MVILHFVAISFGWYAIVCNSSFDVAIRIWSSAYSMVLILVNHIHIPVMVSPGNLSTIFGMFKANFHGSTKKLTSGFSKES